MIADGSTLQVPQVRLNNLLPKVRSDAASALRLRSRSCLRASVVAGAMLLSLNSARGEYHLQAGDVVEISVAGVPELRQRIPVQLDGTVTSPNFGTLSVEGAALSEVRSRIQ